MKLWIARDNAIIPEDMEHFIERHPEKEIEYAKLLFSMINLSGKVITLVALGNMLEKCVKFRIICFQKLKWDSVLNLILKKSNYDRRGKTKNI